jgi:putative glycosyltransferase (TIGR04348 family)
VNIVIINPMASDATAGNSITAGRWAGILHTLGHAVSIAGEWGGQPCDVLIALHARRSHSSIERFRQTCPRRPLIVTLTGTDLYNDFSTSPSGEEVAHSLRLATRIVLLQGAALESLPGDSRTKAYVIYQSAAPPPKLNRKPAENAFEVCVLSHLRDVKDPLRTAFASRLLPASSKIRVLHAGRALDPKWEAWAKQEEQDNVRYRWIGPLAHEAAQELLASSRLFVLSSTAEGGANAIAEAVVCGIPVLCSDIPGNVGMVSRGYPGYFPARNTEELARMMNRAETDAAFMNELRFRVRTMQDRFSPCAGIEQWDRLLRPFSDYQI